MKILHLIFSFNVGGSESMLVDILNEQSKSEDCHFVVVNDACSEDLLSSIEARVSIHKINRKKVFYSVIPFVRLNFFIFKLNPDVIHCHHPDLLWVLLPTFWGKACLTVHSVGKKNQSINLYKKCFSISKCVQYDILERYKLDTTLVYNGIDTSLIKDSKSNYLEKSNLKIVVVGRLDHRLKGQDIIIKSISPLIHDNKLNISLHFIGDGSSREYLEEIIENLDLTKNVSFLGKQSRACIYSRLKDYDLLVQPSRHEGFGLTVVEGMAAKIPVLVSNIDGPIEIIDHGKYGFFFESGSVDSLKKSILEIIMLDNNLLREKVEAAYLRVKNDFCIKGTAANYLKCYNDMTSSNNGCNNLV